MTLVSFGDDGADSAGSLVRCRNNGCLFGGAVPFLKHPAIFLALSSVQRPGGLKADLRQKLKADMKTPCGWTKVRHRAFA
ncbi:hypothetical protein QUW41_06090 [Slackia piriformis]|nr:hypothetical protein [Slackia piriformis]